MLNYLRADFYRLHKGVGWGYLLILPCFVLVVSLFAWVSKQGGVPVGDLGVVEVSMGQSLLHMAAGTGFVAKLLMLLPACMGVTLVAEDYTAGSFKSMLAVPHARRSYLASKMIVALATSAAHTTALLLSLWLFPLLFGVPYEEAVSLPDVALWWVVAVAVGFAYAVLCLLVAIAVRKEAITWILVLFVGFGIVGMSCVQLLDACTELLPGLSDVLGAVARGMLYTQSRIPALGAGLSQQDPLLLAQAVLVSLAWAAASAALAHAVFRRRAL